MSELPAFGVATHYVCVKGNDHWLSHVVDWGPAPQKYADGCRVEIRVEGGHIVHLTVLPDAAREDNASAASASTV